MGGAISFKTNTWTVRDVLRRFPQLHLDPDYQREGNIWSLSRRQLFLDSILNGFDSPKIYLHQLVPPEFSDDSLLRYAVIDGRQRLEALRAFAEGSFSLGNDFRLLGDDDLEAPEDSGVAEDSAENSGFAPFSQLTLPGLQDRFKTLARRFFEYPLTIVVVTTDDVSYIEELFFRLNEGSPLTSAEKRNRGELLRATVNEIKLHPVFESFGILDRRGRLNDLAVRFLFFEEFNANLEAVPDLRVRALDSFTAKFRPEVGRQFNHEQERAAKERLAELSAAVIGVLNRFEGVFQPNDHLLRLTGDIMTFYVMLRSVPTVVDGSTLRGSIEEFFARATSLEGLDEEALSADELSVLDYFGASQGTTTGSYLAARATLIQRFAAGDLKLRSPTIF